MDISTGIWTIIGAAVGAAVGSVLTYWLAIRGSDRQEKQRAENERRKERQHQREVWERLTEEIESNRSLTDHLRTRVTRELGGTYPEMELTKRVRFLREKLPNWQRVIWEGQAALLPVVLGQNAQQVNRLYSQLQDLQSYHETMTEHMPQHLVYNYDAWWMTYQGGQIPDGRLENSSFKSEATDFLKRTEETWRMCEGLLNTLHVPLDLVPVNRDEVS